MVVQRERERLLLAQHGVGIEFIGSREAGSILADAVTAQTHHEGGGTPGSEGGLFKQLPLAVGARCMDVKVRRVCAGDAHNGCLGRVAVIAGIHGGDSERIPHIDALGCQHVGLTEGHFDPFTVGREADAVHIGCNLVTLQREFLGNPCLVAGNACSFCADGHVDAPDFQSCQCGVGQVHGHIVGLSLLSADAHQGTCALINTIELFILCTGQHTGQQCKD